MVSAWNKPSVLLRTICCAGSAHDLARGCVRQRISELRPGAVFASVFRSHSSRQDPTDLDVYLNSSDYVDQSPQYALLNLPTLGHNLFIVHPRVKRGPPCRRTTTDELQLAEAVALTETLPGWKVRVKMLLNTVTEKKKFVFGKGNLEKIRDTLRSNADITALFFNMNMLTGAQHAALADHFGLPIYDRYTMVLNIFRQHARTKESKLQIALAEVPYYRSRIFYLHKAPGQREGAMGHAVRGSGETHYARCQRLLSERELGLRRRLEDLKAHRELLRHKRTKLELPVVAVVGYTNAGKTSLIKALTEDEPKDSTQQDGRQSHVCNVCGDVFDRPAQLTKHVRSHGEQERTYECPHCRKAYKYVGNLRTHLRTHTGERPYMCDVCGLRFTCSSYLQVHLRTHVQRKPYVCSECNKSFVHNSALSVHMRSHTGEQPYKCSHCDLRFSHLRNMKRHEICIHTRRYPHNCDVCHKGFLVITHWRQHMTMHHSASE